MTVATAQQTKTGYDHITKVPGVCGGKASIDHTRVRVNNVVLLAKNGYTAEEIIEKAYPQLSLAQVHSAIAYYHDNREEIDAELEAEKGKREIADKANALYRSKHPAR